MRSLRSDPYLWVHLAGVAVLPIFLELCLLGLGMGSSLMPTWFELLFVGGLGISPILWMQWQKPFNIFSLLLLAVRPDQLSEDQRKILRLFKSPINQFLSVGVAVLMAVALWWIYQVAPIVHGLIFPSATRGTGLLVAAIAFFFANLFLQVPVSVLRVLLVGENTFATTEPYPVEQIPHAFTLIGLRVTQILPALIPKPSKPVVVRPLEVSVPKASVSKEMQKTVEETRQEIEEVGEAIASEIASEISSSTPPESQSIDAATVEEPTLEAPTPEEPIAAVFEEPEPSLPETPSENEKLEQATIAESPDPIVEANFIETNDIPDIFEDAIAPVSEASETAVEDGVFEEAAIAHEPPEAVVESEIIELEVVELEVIALGSNNFFEADEIIEVVERIEVVETVSEETVSEIVSEEEAIAPEPVEEDWPPKEDWGDDEDLDEL